jgi:hypothetical protein
MNHNIYFNIFFAGLSIIDGYRTTYPALHATIPKITTEQNI